MQKAVPMALICIALCWQMVEASQPRSYEPVALMQGASTEFPIHSIADGVVVLNLLVNAAGDVRQIEALRDIPSLTAVSESSVRSWKFQPARHRGAPVEAGMVAAFVFRPPTALWSPPHFAPVRAAPRAEAEAGMRYRSPGILSVAYADYPADSVASGFVVLQVTVGASGKPTRVTVVRDMPGFSERATRAAKQWRFQPAELNGARVESNVAIAFVFAPPRLNPRAARELKNWGPAQSQR
jgi:TonB family protein